MKTILIAMSFAVSSLAFAAPAAKPVDPLWSKAVALNASVRNWIPEDIDIKAETDDGDEVKKVRSRSHLTGWEKGKPRYVVTDIEPKAKPGKKDESSFNIDGFTAMTDDVLTMDAAVKRIDKQELHGAQWTVFQVSKSETGVKITIKLWVDPQSGVLHQTESVILVPLLADINIVTAYGPHPVIGQVPKVSDINVDVRIPFKSAKLHMVNTPSNWIKRPQ